MTSTAVETIVFDVLKNVSRRPIEPAPHHDLIADLGFDSIQVMETVAELEDRFGISIPMTDLPDTRTVAQVVARVTELVERQPEA